MLFRSEPRFDGEETADAGFFSLTEMGSMQGVQTLSRWGIEHALQTQPGSGLSPAENGPGADRPGRLLFGLSDVDPAVWT